jgi:hypothetical protein
VCHPDQRLDLDQPLATEVMIPRIGPVGSHCILRPIRRVALWRAAGRRRHTAPRKNNAPTRPCEREYRVLSTVIVIRKTASAFVKTGSSCSRRQVWVGPTHKVAALQPAAREQEPRGR